MSLYSFKVQSRDEVIISSRALAIGEGIDVFSKRLEDLPEFLAELSSLGVRVLEYHQLDNLEAIQPDLAMIADSANGPMLPSVGEQYPPKAEE
jgi:hypothetical protein